MSMHVEGVIRHGEGLLFDCRTCQSKAWGHICSLSINEHVHTQTYTYIIYLHIYMYMYIYIYKSFLSKY